MTGLRFAVLALLMGVAVWVFFFLQAAGVFYDRPAVSVGSCRAVTGGGIAGVEDLAIDRSTGIAYLSGYDRWKAAKGETVRGAIWTYRLDDPGAEPVDATAGQLPGGFHPHGISLWRETDGRKVLFVINHAGGRHSVEIFDVDGTQLVHRRSVTGDAMVSPNDIVGTGYASFYVTNDHRYATGVMRTVEDFGRLRLTTVEAFDGMRFRTVISGLGGANGINLSADGRSLYVSAAAERRVHVHDRQPLTGELRLRRVIDVPGFADNIDVQANGDLLLAVHSKIFALLGHVGDETRRAPSHLLRLRADGTGGFTPETIHYSDGSDLSAASVAAGLGNRLLVGGIFERKVLDCNTGP